MQDVVILPTFDRPEMLWLCLDHLSQSPDHQSVLIQVYVDAHVGQVTPREEIEEVLDKFPQLAIQAGFREPHRFAGNSFNVMMAYKETYESDARYVFLIEDDIVIRPEFFAWHRYQHQRALGCSIGVVKEPQHGRYASLGVCFRRETLHLLMPHCTVAYFADMRRYCRATFPPSKYDCEQDGVWARVLEREPIVWASTPRAQHVGWYGYHRPKSVRPTGTLDERYEQVKKVLTNPGYLKAWSRDFRDVQTIGPVGN